MKTALNQEILQGTGISRGVAVGKPHFWDLKDAEVPSYAVEESDLERERRRFKKSWAGARDDLERLKCQLESEGARDAVAIIEAQLQLLGDPLLYDAVGSALESEGRNVEVLLSDVVERFRVRFETMDDPYFRDRFQDLEDVKQRILGHLLMDGVVNVSKIPEGAVIVAPLLAPSHTAAMQRHVVAACVTEKGGVTSHAAIVAKAKGVPMVTGIDVSKLCGPEVSQVIVDGVTGRVIINPSHDTLKKYRSMQRRLGVLQDLLLEQRELPAETHDGYRVRLCVNVEDIEEIDHVHEHCASGVGLFRSEYLLLTNKKFPSEEQQYQVYSKLAERLQGLPLVVRVFDVGGDKNLDEESGWQDVNPYLSLRAIRFLLRERDIFRTQVRAILRATAHGKVKILLPMVSGVEELRQAKEVIAEVRDDLIKKKEPIADSIAVGTMIELPSAALIADHLAAESDFLSIGTNDLIQYALAVDRTDHTMTGHYVPTHPGVLRLISYIVSEAHKHKVPVSLCGEMAADPRYTALLLGLGVEELSVAMRHVLLIKHVIRRVNIVEARKLSQQVLAMDSHVAIDELLAHHYSLLVPEDCLQP